MEAVINEICSLAATLRGISNDPIIIPSLCCSEYSRVREPRNVCPIAEAIALPRLSARALFPESVRL